jgi:hypothetical protein
MPQVNVFPSTTCIAAVVASESLLASHVLFILFALKERKILNHHVSLLLRLKLIHDTRTLFQKATRPRTFAAAFLGSG